MNINQSTVKIQVKKYTKFYLIIILLLFVFFLGLFIGERSKFYSEDGFLFKKVFEKETKPKELAKEIDFDLFWQIWNLIKEKYAERPVSDLELFYGALSGMVASLNDPYSIYLKPEISKKFIQELSGSFEGIGAEIGIKEGRLTIIAPLIDSPAEKAGLKAGDKIYAIDDSDTTDMALDYAVSLIRGPKGTPVTLTILRKESKESQKITIIRSVIKIKSVSWKMLENNISYIKLSYFNEDTEQDFRKVALEILKQNPRGIILDTRNNPGGFLEAAIKVASFWIEDGVIVIEDRGIKEVSNSLLTRREYPSQGQALFKNFKTVVLINQGSASGSEIVAGALKDYGKATLVGTKTFGKGSVQELENLKDDSSLKITVAHWLTPKGHSIEKEGISPDIEIELTGKDFDEDKDPQLEKAIELLSP